MLRDRLAQAKEIARDTLRQWQSHRSTELAASLAFFGALALAGLALVAVYAAGWFSDAHSAQHAAGAAGNAAGRANARFIDMVLRAAARGHDRWVAAVIGGIAFFLAVAATAMRLQRMLDAIWDEGKKSAGDSEARKAKRHAGQFVAIYALTLLLIALLFAGAAVHGLTYHTHRLPALQGTLYQALDVGVSIVLLTFVFLFIFAYLPPANIPWRNVWIASVVSAVLYERGQFALAVYFGLMDATSPYADAGVLLAVLVWLYYSAQVVLVGAAFTKTLYERSSGQSKRKSQAA